MFYFVSYCSASHLHHTESSVCQELESKKLGKKYVDENLKLIASVNGLINEIT